jgi:hypothetical protein
VPNCFKSVFGRRGDCQMAAMSGGKRKGKGGSGGGQGLTQPQLGGTGKTRVAPWAYNWRRFRAGPAGNIIPAGSAEDVRQYLSLAKVPFDEVSLAIEMEIGDPKKLPAWAAKEHDRDTTLLKRFSGYLHKYDCGHRTDRFQLLKSVTALRAPRLRHAVHATGSYMYGSPVTGCYMGNPESITWDREDPTLLHGAMIDLGFSSDATSHWSHVAPEGEMFNALWANFVGTDPHGLANDDRRGHLMAVHKLLEYSYVTQDQWMSFLDPMGSRTLMSKGFELPPNMEMQPPG